VAREAGADSVVKVVIALAVACHVDATPQPVSCGQMADHVFALIEPKNGHARLVRDAFENRCDADHWSEVARNCIADEPALAAGRHCKEHLTEAQRAHLDASLAAADLPREAAPPIAGEQCSAALATDCAEYCELVFRLADCTALPTPTREALRQMWAQIEPQLVGGGTGLSSSCRGAADQMQQVGHSYSCW
jgi:hypothetical protein